MQEKPVKSLKILNIRIDSTSKERVLRQVQSFLLGFDKKRFKKPLLITTPNPEQVMRAQTDKVFEKILNTSDIALPDGIGLIAAHKFLSLPSTKYYLLKPILYFAQGMGVGFSVIFDRKWLEDEIRVIHGREMFIDLIELANKKNYAVVLVGDRNASAQKARKELEKNYKKVKITAFEGPNLDEHANPRSQEDKKIEEKLVTDINNLSPQMLIVGFGAPIQEKWVYRRIHELNAGVIMVVGGTFDYISGKKSIPPEWVNQANLEWVWRLLNRDQKVKRVVNAFPKFPLAVFKAKLLKK